MPFYSAIAELDATRKTDALPHQGEPAWWLVVPLPGYGLDLQLHFKLIRDDSSPLERIIAALTSSPVVHVETLVGGNAPEDVRKAAESLLDRPYDYYGALRAWDNSGVHADGKEFCSGMAEKIIEPELYGLQRYPNPGRLLMQVSQALGLPSPKLYSLAVAINDSDLDYLQSLRDASRISTGTWQEVLAELGVQP